MKHVIKGVHCAAATPVNADGAPDLDLFGAHCRALIDEGCHGIAMLGTTGEANSFGMNERMDLLDAAIAGGTEPGMLLPGTSAPSVADAVALTRHALAAGVKGVVMLPPYYYKDNTDEGLFRFYARVIDAVGDDRLRVVLYHIPRISQVPITHPLIERLMAEFPGIVCGIKDSHGDLDSLLGLCRDFPDLGVLAGADPLMLPLLKAGGAGCITATSNLAADSLRVVWDGWDDPARADEVAQAQDRIVAWRTLATRYVQLPTIKTMVARRRGDNGWLHMKPPLVELSDAECADVWSEMDRLGG